MDADLNLRLISVYCTADDLLPERPANARRTLSDAEIVTLCVAQVLIGIPSDRRFLRAAHPPAHRVGLLHLQGPALPRTPRSPHAAQPVRTNRDRLLALAACISLNHELGRPSRAIANFTA